MPRELELLVNGARRQVKILAEERNRVRFSIGERTYDVAYEFPVPGKSSGDGASGERRSAISRPRQSSGNRNEVLAPIPGLVAEICVAPGEPVIAGAVLLKLEAMKMQNNIVSPRDGVIAEVHVEKGAEVGDHQVLISFVPENVNEK